MFTKNLNKILLVGMTLGGNANSETMAQTLPLLNMTAIGTGLNLSYNYESILNSNYNEPTPEFFRNWKTKVAQKDFDKIINEYCTLEQDILYGNLGNSLLNFTEQYKKVSNTVSNITKILYELESEE